MIEQQACEQKKELRAGEMVRLNSGSPDLTVVSRSKNGRVTVEFMNDAGAIERYTASEACFTLQPVPCMALSA
jgi:uncharacterized protein YodC (DUF2158 family)